MDRNCLKEKIKFYENILKLFFFTNLGLSLQSGSTVLKIRVLQIIVFLISNNLK